MSTKFHWNTKQLVDEISKIKLVSQVTIHGPGGDVDSSLIIVNVKDSQDDLYIRGFVLDFNDSPKDPNDCDVDLIELNDGVYEDQGLSSDSENTGLVYQRIRRLLRDLGAEVVVSLRGYF